MVADDLAIVVDRPERLDNPISGVDSVNQTTPLGNHRTTPAAAFSAKIQHLLLHLEAPKQHSLALVLVVAVGFLVKINRLVVYLAAPQTLRPAEDSSLLRTILPLVGLALERTIRALDLAVEEASLANRITISNSNQNRCLGTPPLLPLEALGLALVSGVGPQTTIRAVVSSATMRQMRLANRNNSRTKILLVALVRHRIKTMLRQHSVDLVNLSSKSRSLEGSLVTNRIRTLEEAYLAIQAITTSSRAQAGVFLAKIRITINPNRVRYSTSQLRREVFSAQLTRILPTAVVGSSAQVLAVTTIKIRISKIKGVGSLVTLIISSKSPVFFPIISPTLEVVCSVIWETTTTNSKAAILFSETAVSSSSLLEACLEIQTIIKEQVY